METDSHRSTANRWWPGSRILAAAILLLSLSAWSLNPNQDIVVQVRKNGPQIAVDVICPVDAPAPVVWEVLTDYEHMARFISNIASSDVEDTAGNLLRVRQKGKASRGPVTLTFDIVREIELVPQSEIRSRLISGDFKSSDFVTRIVTTETGVHIVNNGRYTPNMWVPPFIGPAVIEAETQKQYGEIRAEILRRSAMVRPQSLSGGARNGPPAGQPAATSSGRLQTANENVDDVGAIR
jgi:hypothetical protein